MYTNESICKTEIPKALKRYRFGFHEELKAYNDYRLGLGLEAIPEATKEELSDIEKDYKKFKKDFFKKHKEYSEKDEEMLLEPTKLAIKEFEQNSFFKHFYKDTIEFECEGKEAIRHNEKHSGSFPYGSFSNELVFKAFECLIKDYYYRFYFGRDLTIPASYLLKEKIYDKEKIDACVSFLLNEIMFKDKEPISLENAKRTLREQMHKSIKNLFNDKKAKSLDRPYLMSEGSYNAYTYIKPIKTTKEYAKEKAAELELGVPEQFTEPVKFMSQLEEFEAEKPVNKANLKKTDWRSIYDASEGKWVIKKKHLFS